MNLCAAAPQIRKCVRWERRQPFRSSTVRIMEMRGQSEPSVTTEQAAANGVRPTGLRSEPLPGLETSLGEAEIRARLDAASRKGRLPGYHNHGDPGGVLFSVSAFGNPFDGVLLARVEHAEGAPTRLRFEARMCRGLPLLFVAALVTTVWPGVYFMDQLMIQVAPGWREALPTWWWYLPLTILSLPWAAWSVFRRARRSIEQSSRQAIEGMAREVDGRPVEPPQATPR